MWCPAISELGIASKSVYGAVDSGNASHFFG